MEKLIYSNKQFYSLPNEVKLFVFCLIYREIGGINDVSERKIEIIDELFSVRFKVFISVMIPLEMHSSLLMGAYCTFSMETS